MAESPESAAPQTIEVIKEVPVEIIKEVPVEVEVIREVPVEIIKEVPVEVIKEIEVIREVPVEVEVIREVPVEIIKEVPVDVIKEVEVIKEIPGLERIVEVEKIVYTDNPLIQKLEALISESDILINDAPVSTRFGTAFPTKPKTGDQFLRVDMTPNTMYRYNGKNWVVYNEDLSVEQLIEQLVNGIIEMDDLNTQQLSQVKKYLKKENVLGK